jgi:hypothetical protein
VTEERPKCECHGEPMHKVGCRNGKQYWRCAAKNRDGRDRWLELNRDRARAYQHAYYAAHREAKDAARMERYWSMTGQEHNRTLLQKRRAGALRRMARRKERAAS